jgi:hypothetical protein
MTVVMEDGLERQFRAGGDQLCMPSRSDCCTVLAVICSVTCSQDGHVLNVVLKPGNRSAQQHMANVLQMRIVGVVAITVFFIEFN